MKLILAIFAVLAMAAAECPSNFNIKTSEDLANYRTECIASLHLPEQKADDFKKWKFEAADACYIKCVFNKMGLFDDVQGFCIENLVVQLGQSRSHDEIRPDIVKSADAIKEGESACDWVFRGFTSFRAANLPLIKQSVAKHD